MTADTIERDRESFETKHHLCAHQRFSCQRCPRCFHGWHRCHWCWRSRSGLPPRPKKVKLRCASCGRFRKPHPADVCDRCDQLGFEALTLF